MRLPRGSRDPYFTDEIGNVSTSKFRSSPREAHLELKPRYPLFGGWNYTFTVGWNNHLSRFLVRDGAKHTLQVPFLEGADNVVYQDIRARIILPEGAMNIHVEGLSPDMTVTQAVHKTFMDTIGRSVIVIEATNLDDEHAKRPINVSYEYHSLALLRKPLVVAIAVGMIFIASLLLHQVL